jgi:hypothetical protein
VTRVKRPRKAKLAPLCSPGVSGRAVIPEKRYDLLAQLTARLTKEGVPFEMTDHAVVCIRHKDFDGNTLWDGTLISGPYMSKPQYCSVNFTPGTVVLYGQRCPQSDD